MKSNHMGKKGQVFKTLGKSYVLKFRHSGSTSHTAEDI